MERFPDNGSIHRGHAEYPENRRQGAPGSTGIARKGPLPVAPRLKQELTRNARRTGREN